MKEEEMKEQLKPETVEALNEWLDVTQKAKMLFKDKFMELAEDGQVSSTHIISAVTACSQMVGSMISLIPDKEAQEKMCKAFAVGVEYSVLHERLEGTKEGFQQCR